MMVMTTDTGILVTISSMASIAVHATMVNVLSIGMLRKGGGHQRHRQGKQEEKDGQPPLQPSSSGMSSGSSHGGCSLRKNMQERL